jgi:hypothetical protein
MKLHNFTKLVESYKNIKQTIKKETRKAYKGNNISYNENLNKTDGMLSSLIFWARTTT